MKLVFIKKIQWISIWNDLQKRIFDFLWASFGIIFLWWLILLAAFVAWIDTGENGFFTQKRVGRHGKIFKVIKIRTMRSKYGVNISVTSSNDSRITSTGRFFRKTKIDELPQLINIILGDMSFVGPRPDVAGYADSLIGEDKMILSMRPGITGPATLKYRNEEILLAKVDDPQRYNDEVIYPDKVRINREYVQNWSFWKDIYYIWKTIFH